MTRIRIEVQEKDFDLNHEYQALIQDNTEDGAVTMFVGRVREMNQGQLVNDLELEHYPAMSQKSLHSIAQQASEKWQISRLTIIHRVGKLTLSDQIVLVGVTSPHRQAAFSAAQFLMDYLKTQAPFWKKETTQDGEQIWVKAEDKDLQASKRWS